jgi:hypothetical protein
VSRKGRRFRQLQTVPIGFKQVWLLTRLSQPEGCSPCKCLKISLFRNVLGVFH